MSKILEKSRMLFLLLLLSGSIVAQDFSLENFEGHVYKFPSKLKYRPFNAEYADFPVVAEVSYRQLNFDQRHLDKGFPGIEGLECFGIMFTNQLRIQQGGHYRFTLISDDGSILWLDEKEKINNDYSNGMHKKEDTLFLHPGEYAMKIWYFQAYPTKLGLIFDVERLEGDVAITMDSFQLNNQFLFETNSATLLKEAALQIDSITQKLTQYSSARIRIVGHTDNTGSLAYNLQLSEKRAHAIRQAILEKKLPLDMDIVIEAKSFTQPLVPNDTEEGRKQNRRVEIFIEGYE